MDIFTPITNAECVVPPIASKNAAVGGRRPELKVATKSPLHNSGGSASLENYDSLMISRSQKRTGDLNDSRNFQGYRRRTYKKRRNQRKMNRRKTYRH